MACEGFGTGFRGVVMPKLKLKITRKISESYDLGGAVTIGRGEENDIVLLDGAISRLHAVIVRDRDRFAIRDNNSANGVHVNGTKVDRQVLEEGDLIQLGKKKLLFEVESPVTEEPGETIDLTQKPLADYPMKEIVEFDDVLMIIPTIEPLMEMIYEIAAQMVIHTAISDEDQGSLIFAIQEAIRNAAKHGNKFNPGKIIRFRFVKDPYKIMAVVTDEGPGFDYRSMLDKARELGREVKDTSELPVGISGAGVLKMLWNVDRVEFNKTGNEIFLTRFIGTSKEAMTRREREKWNQSDEISLEAPTEEK
jgi:anti-sigma regulatory factor (Ser/Thr protein kinase)